LRRRLAWAALLVAMVAAAWVGSAWRSGQHRIFASGTVSTAHRMIENDCRQCHTTWAPLQRLLGSADTGGIRSVDNAKCLACHDEPLHHAKQVPGHGHDGLSCADCHREHRGHSRLARVEDRQCLRCHRDLVTTDGPTGTFVHSVTTFEAGGARSHPEFALKRLILASDETPIPGPRHGVWRVAETHVVDGEAERRFRDKASLGFNHAAHLKAERNERGELVVGLRDEHGQMVDFSQRCEACHEPDAWGAYMQPIQFKMHCRRCHPLLFDNRNDPGRQVPHVTADLVRGWLTREFTLAALDGDKAPGKTLPAATDDPPQRPFPGRRRLDAAGAGKVRDRLAAAEIVVQQHVHTLFGREAKGGCRFCHVVSLDRQRDDWHVVPPAIPGRWMLHSRFRHDSHRLVKCTVCHGDVMKSMKTADILMPSISVCRSCHAAAPFAEQFADSRVGARSDCVECHVYHGREDGKPLDGPMAITLPSDRNSARRH